MICKLDKKWRTQLHECIRLLVQVSGEGTFHLVSIAEFDHLKVDRDRFGRRRNCAELIFASIGIPQDGNSSRAWYDFSDQLQPLAC